MNVGISQLAVGAMPLDEFFPAASNAGYDVVELSMLPSGPITGATSDADIAAILELSRAASLPVAALTINHCTGNLLDSGQARETSIEETIFGLEVAAKLGAPVTLHTLGRFSSDLYYDDAYHNAVAALKKLAPVAQRLGVDLAVEFVWNGFLFSPMEVARFLDDVGSNSIGFYFDPGNMAVFQFPHHWVRIIGRRIKRVHMKDWRGGPLNGDWTAPQEGEVDFARIMTELRVAGYDGPLISEVPPSLASLEQTAAAIRRIIALG